MVLPIQDCAWVVIQHLLGHAEIHIVMARQTMLYASKTPAKRLENLRISMVFDT